MMPIARSMPARAALFLAIAHLPTSTAAAQSATGTIEGIVVDSAGATMTGVTVTITNRETDATRALATDHHGRFTAPALPIGRYEVEAARARFATQRQRDVDVHVGSTVALRLELRVAQAPETITIAERLPMAEPTRTDASYLIDRNAIDHLPARARDALELVPLAPAITRADHGELIVSGQRGTLSSLYVEGAFEPTIGLSQESVREIRVNTAAYPAEYGRAAAGSINVVTKSGTNERHGWAFAFFGDDSLNANGDINERLGRTTPPYGYRQFGGAIGGPIEKGRHFFFGTYDREHTADTNVVFLNIPSNAPRDAGTQSAVARLRPLADSWERTRTQDRLFLRTDHELSKALRLTLWYNHLNVDGAGYGAGGPQVSRQSTGESTVLTRTFSAAGAATFGAALVNEARVHISRNRDRDTAYSDTPHALIRQSGNDVLQIGQSVFSPHAASVTRVQAADALTWMHGLHDIKSGVDVQVDNVTSVMPFNFTGAYTFSSLASFNRGVPTGAGDTYTQAFARSGSGAAEPRITDFSVFVQDQWQATDGVTVNAGLRYDAQSFSPEVAFADRNNFGPRVGVAWSPQGTRYVVRGAYGLFYGRTPAPPVAWALVNNGVNVQTFTVRGGSGQPVPAYPARLAAIPTRALVRPTIFRFAPDYENAKTQQASAGFEWEWMPNTSLSMKYVSVSGSHLPRSTDVNLGAASPVTLTVTDAAGTPIDTVQHDRFAPGPLTQFDRVIELQSSAESRYNGLTIEMNRRFSQNYQYGISYTLAKVEDTVPDATALVPESSDDRKFASNPANFELDRAVGNGDRRHRFVVSGIYRSDAFAEGFEGLLRTLFNNWTLSVVYIAQSGLPYSAYVAGDINGDRNLFNDRAPGTQRNQFRLPMAITIDPRLARSIRIKEGTHLMVVWEAFNLLNRSNYTKANDTLYDLVGGQLRRNPLFAEQLAQADPRVMQVGVRLTF